MTTSTISQSDSAAALARISRTPTTAPTASFAHQLEHARRVKVVQQWVGQTFFGTILKQMHHSPFKSDLFDGGRGGQAYSSLYDQQLASRISRGAGRKLVNAIVRKLDRKFPVNVKA